MFYANVNQNQIFLLIIHLNRGAETLPHPTFVFLAVMLGENCKFNKYMDYLMGEESLPAVSCSSSYNNYSLGLILALGNQKQTITSGLGIFLIQFNYTSQLFIESFPMLNWVSVC